MREFLIWRCSYAPGHLGFAAAGRVSRTTRSAPDGLRELTAIHAWVFGSWWPLNVLLNFCLAACLVWAVDRREWPLAAFLGLLAPAFVDCQWTGVWLVLAAWHWFKGRAAWSTFLPGMTRQPPWLTSACLCLSC
ncbi:TraX family protein [Xanthomonas arboricola]|uniref:TraX family protein n=1 Tax=Xanthomonas arboricola TaxID=56448 RepID=UPI003D187D04